MKWYTCCPVAFTGCKAFFRRDSGAFCLAFQQLGIESKVILPLPVRDENGNPDLIRTEYKNLESPDWWKSLKIDGLVLYAWGMGKYTPIVKAAREAGIYVITFMDTSGIYYPWKHWQTLTKHIFQCELIRYGKIKGFIRAMARIIKAHTWNLFDIGRRKHLKSANQVSFPLPQAINSIKNLEWFYGKDVVNKSILLPCPIITNNIDYNIQEKENIIITVGRWEDVFQKNPQLLIQTISKFSNQVNNWKICIYGTITDELTQWHNSLPTEKKQLILLKGIVPNHELEPMFVKSKICLCTSRFESSHIVSAEALCKGTTIVGPKNLPHLNCLEWYVSHDSGLLSPKNTPESLAQTLIEETQNWEKGNRNPEEISSFWQEQLLAVNSCRKILDIYQTSRAAHKQTHSHY